MLKLKQIKSHRATVRTLAAHRDQFNADVLLPILCIGTALMIPFITIANLLMTRHH